MFKKVPSYWYECKFVLTCFLMALQLATHPVSLYYKLVSSKCISTQATERGFNCDIFDHLV